MKFICIFLLFNLTYLALAQDKKEVLEAKDKSIVIGNLDAPVLSLNQKEYIKKIIIRTLAKQQKYHLVIRDAKLSKKLQKLSAVEVQISQHNKNNFKVVAQIKDLASQQLIKKVSGDKIPFEQLNRKVEILIEILFDIRKKKIAKERIKSIRTAKKGRGKKKRTNKVTPAAPVQAINLKDRILALKQNIKEEFIKKKKQQEEQKEKQKEASEPKQIQKTTAQILNERPPNNPENKINSQQSEVYSLSYELGTGITSLSTQSLNRKGTFAEVSLTDSLNFLTLDASIAIRFKKVNFFKTYFNYTYKRPMLISEDYELSSLSDMKLGLFSDLIFSRIRLGFFYLKEQVAFSSIPQVGEGIFLSVYEVSYMGLSLVFNLNKTYNLGTNIYNLIDSSAIENSPSNTLSSANKLEVFLDYKTSIVAKNSSLRFSFIQQQFVAQDSNQIEFNFNQSAFKGNLIFAF